MAEHGGGVRRAERVFGLSRTGLCERMRVVGITAAADRADDEQAE